MLVSGDPKVAGHPIIGFNVIEELLSRWDKEMPKLEAILKVSRLFSVEMKSARSVLKLMQKLNAELHVGEGYSWQQVKPLPSSYVPKQEPSLEERVCCSPHVNYHNLLRVWS